jgi:hypothetical protein
VWRRKGSLLVLAGLVGVVGVAAASSGPAPPSAIRVDQLGYAPAETKTAYLISTSAHAGAAFTVVDANGRAFFRGHAQPSRGTWNSRYRAVLPLDFSGLRRIGAYRVRLAGTTSPPFRIASVATLLRPRVADTVAFFEAQRDGAHVVPGSLHRKPAHLNDRAGVIYAWPRYESPDSDVILGASLKRIGGPVDAEGGWMDAGDFVKFTHTTAYADTLLFVAERELGHSAPATLDPEARFGLRWLGKTWDPQSGVMLLQVAIGSGNKAGTFHGDHDLWRLPEKDDTLPGKANVYIRHRPVFRANEPGTRLPPNLAGRVSAAFALAAQLDAKGNRARAQRELATAAAIYGAAKTKNVRAADVVTALPHAFYPESSWRDDMELGGAELALAAFALGDEQKASGWIADASTWAKAYLAHEAGHDTLNLYDTSALADAELVQALRRSGRGRGAEEARLLGGMRAQLEIGMRRGNHDPFRAGAVYSDFDAAPHTFGLIATAGLYASLTHDHRFDAFATQQRDWALGANAWGASLMIGVGSSFPQCPQHVAANLSGRQDGKPPILRGAVVNGPNSTGIFAGGLGSFFSEGHTCPADEVDRYAPFTGHGSRYVDDVRSWQTVEPALDFDAAAALAFAVTS